MSNQNLWEVPLPQFPNCIIESNIIRPHWQKYSLIARIVDILKMSFHNTRGALQLTLPGVCIAVIISSTVLAAEYGPKLKSPPQEYSDCIGKPGQRIEQTTSQRTELHTLNASCIRACRNHFYSFIAAEVSILIHRKAQGESQNQVSLVQICILGDSGVNTHSASFLFTGAFPQMLPSIWISVQEFNSDSPSY